MIRWLIAIVLASWAHSALAQQNLDQTCGKIPYTVGRQEVLAQAYGRVAGTLATGIPVVGALTNPQLNAMYASVREVIAGEALQALSSIRANYRCRIRATLPANKHAHADAVLNEAFAFSAMMRGMDWGTPEGVQAALDYYQSRAETAIPAIDNVPAANRVSAAEILAAIGNPDFTSRHQTQTSLTGAIGPAELGVCGGVVNASLAALDNATLASLGAHHVVLADLASSSTRAAAYQRMFTDLQTILTPQSNNAVISAVRAASNKNTAKGCLQKVADAAPESTPPATTGNPTSASTGSGGTPGATSAATSSQPQQ